MAKPQKRYVCQACGSATSKWAGQCADCAEWNSLVEEASAVVTPFAARHDLRSGGRPVALRDLRGPAVINLWASWCAPCRKELPAMQRLADATTGRLHVIGVDSGDDRGAAAEFATDAKVTLSTLFDSGSRLAGALGRPAIPITVFVDASGKRHVYDRVPPDDAELAALVRANTGVPVQP